MQNTKFIKFIRIFLLVLIIIGLSLLMTQKMWVPKVVDMILNYENKTQQSSVTTIVNDKSVALPTNTNIVGNKNIGDLKPNTFEWCMTNGGKDITPNFNAPKKCVLNNRIYESNCVSNDKYFVVAQNLTDSVGSDTLVKYKSTSNKEYACEYSISEGDFKVSDDASYVMALEGNYLIIDTGTGPDPRGLIIYNLLQRKKVFTDSYSSPVEIKNNTISYWTESSIKATKDNCPDFSEFESNGLGLAIDTRVVLDLSTMTKKELGEYRCSPRQ